MTSETFRQWRAQHGLTQTDAARLLGVEHRTTIARYEAGATRVPGPVARLLQLLDNPMIYTLARSLEEKKEPRATGPPCRDCSK